MELGFVRILVLVLSTSFAASAALTSYASSVSSQQVGDFAITTSPNTLTLSQGGTSHPTVTLSSQGGYQGNVTLTAQTFGNLRIGAGLSPYFIPLSPTQTSGNSIMTVSVDQWVQPGTYNITVEAFDGFVQHSSQVTVQVTGQDFSISASPSRLSFPLKTNLTLSANLIVNSLGGFNDYVNISIAVMSNFPGVTMKPFVNPISSRVLVSPTSPQTLTVAIAVNSSMIAAPYFAEVTGVAKTTAKVPHTYDVGVNIGPDYTISANPPNIVVHRGAMAVSTVTVTSINGLTGNIAMYLGPLSVQPPNPQSQNFPADPTLTAGGSNTSLLVVMTDSRTSLGTYSVFIESNLVSGWIGNSLPLTLTVEGLVTGPDFTMYADPVHPSASIGSTTRSTINFAGVNGFSGPLTLNVGLYGGPIATLFPSTVSIAGYAKASSTLTLTNPPPVPCCGGYPAWFAASGTGADLVIATAQSGVSHGVWVNASAAPFGLRVTPAQQQVRPGSTIQFTVAVSPIAGFNGTLSLSTAAPTQVAASLSNVAMNFSQQTRPINSTLSINVSADAPASDYEIEVTTTYNRPEALPLCCTRTFPVTYTVPAHVIVTSPSNTPSNILGLPPVEFYSIIGAAVAAVAVSSAYLVVRRRRVVSPTPGLPS